MKVMLLIMASVLLVAFMVAAYGFVAIEPDALEIAGLLGGLAVSPIVLGYGYKGLRTLTKGLTDRQGTADDPYTVTSIATQFPYEVAQNSDAAYRVPVESLLAMQSSPDRSLELKSKGYSPEQSLRTTQVDERSDKTACPFCGEAILRVAKKCKHCGEFLDALVRQRTGGIPQNSVIHVHVKNQSPHQTAGTSNALAVICTFFWPGLGQMVQGRVGSGIAWMFAAFFGYLLFVFPGLIIHLCCIVDASKFGKTR